MEENSYKRNRYKEINIKDILYLAFYFIVVELVLVLPLIALVFMNVLTIEMSTFIVVNMKFIILFILGIIWYKDYINKDFKFLMANKKEFIGRIFLYIAAGLVLSVLINMLIQVPDSENQIMIEDLFNKFPIIGAISITIMGPFIEEIIFRYILIGKVSSVIGTKFASIMSCIFFAFIHSYFSVSIIAYLPMSIFMTLIYIKNGKNLSSSIIFHVVWNSFALIIS